MPRPKAQAALLFQKTPELQRFDEANVGRLGLISIQERISSEYASWKVEFEIDGRRARLSCDALPKYGGVPHGLDNDISAALIDLYIESGSPEDGVLRTTAHKILRRAGLDASGRYYQTLEQSLYRLRTATYAASEAWYEVKRRWTTVTFNYLAELEYSSEDDELGFSGASVLKVRLAEPIVRSIRARYLKPLDFEFLTSLDRPLTRALYRLLDARRYPVEDTTLPLSSYTVNLVEWAEGCKIFDKRTNKIRGTLEGAHAELIERGYLKDVVYEGRGQKQSITYHFVTEPEASGEQDPDSPACRALIARRVSRPVARQLVSTFGEAHVLERVGKFDALRAAGYQVRNVAGALVDVVRDQTEKYPAPASAPAAKLPAHQKFARSQEVTEEISDQRSPEEQADDCLRTLQFLLKERLTTTEYALLRERWKSSGAAPKSAVALITKAKRENTLDDALQELKKFIGP
ncbi:replication initiator protein A [Deinococcus rubellus]|uniref:replication initiator protein A n=1 Tax=Deinococcus rubellus TaxID=1889240 RepID=UPI0031F079FE